MKKQKISNKERLLQEKERRIKEMEKTIHRIPEPAYRFEKGDNVIYKINRQCKVDEVLFDGKAYGIITDTKKSGGTVEQSYFVIPWIWLSSESDAESSTDFVKNADMRLNFSPTDIGALLHMYYSMGIDMDPDYQRGYVWNAIDNENLINSIFSNIDIGKITLVSRPDEEYFDDGMEYEILDGKQRLNAIVKFFENRYLYKGKYFRELSQKDKMFFLNTVIPHAVVTNAGKEDIIKYFLILNVSGRRMEYKDMEKAKKLLASYQK